MLPGFQSGNGHVVWREIRQAELAEWLAEAQPPVLLDVRALFEYKQGYIPGSIHLPLTALPEQYHALDPERSYVLVCYSGRRARRAAAFLAEKGFAQVGVLWGGIDAWEGPLVWGGPYA